MSIIFVVLHLLVPTGKVIHAMVAHLDAVTSLAVDPNGLYLMSGSKCQAIQNDLPLENSVIVMALKVRVGRQSGLRN